MCATRFTVDCPPDGADYVTQRHSAPETARFPARTGACNVRLIGQFFGRREKRDGSSEELPKPRYNNNNKRTGRTEFRAAAPV